MLTRRAFLQGVAALPLLPRPAGAAPAKLISLGGPTALTPGGVHDYRAWGNREDVLATGTRWVKVWISWRELEPEPGGTWDALRVIDEQVATANADGVKVMLCVTGSGPDWAGGGRGRFPRDWRAWSRFAGHLVRRYRSGTVAFGNASGAYADAIEFGNEPNLLNWPRADAPRVAATMLRTADRLSAREGGPRVLGPGTADSQRGVEFTRAVLAELRGWRPLGRVGWSHHNYGDMDDGSVERLTGVRDALERAGWPGREIWLTEGGYDTTARGTAVTLAARLRQAEVVRVGYRAASAFSAAAAREGRIGVLPTFAQHCVHDQDAPWNTFKSGLRDDFDFTSTTPGARRPSWYAWRDLG